MSSLSTDSKGRKKSIVDKTIEIINEGCFIDLLIYEGVMEKRNDFLRLHSKDQVIALARKHTNIFHMENEYEKV